MAVRVTDLEVREIIPTKSEHDLSQFITMASAVVDRTASAAVQTGTTLSTQEQKNIEMYLAAHFYAIRYPKWIQQRVGKATVRLQGKTAMGFESTFWGQQALALDPSGVTAARSGATGGQRAVGLTWLGTNTDN